MEWKSVKNYEGYYQISEHGDIRNVKTGKMRKLKVNKKHGYIDIDLYKEGVCEWKRVHRLVAEAFIENPHNLPIVMHIDNNKTNNHYTNLKWGTLSQNTSQAFQDGLEDNRYLYELYNEKETIKVFGSQKLLKEIGYSKNQLTYYIKTNEALKRGKYKGYKIKKLGRLQNLQRLSESPAR